MKKKIILTISVIMLIAAGAAWWGWRYINASYHGAAVWVYIPAGSSPDAVGDSLSAVLGGHIGGRVHNIWLRAAGDNPDAHGAYRILDGDKAVDIARRLKRRVQTPVRVTFNNIRTLEQLAESVASQLEFNENDFMTAVDSVLPGAGFRGREEYPAAFIPDTYEFYWTVPAGKAVERLLDYRNRFWDDGKRARARELGLSPVKVATLASIVEEETNVADERRIVARLYLNRLDRGMLLQADPTVKWAVGDFSLRRILNKHLAVQSPYNTYIHKGLPPGPIRIPDKRTLEAVLDAPAHGYLYMCAKEDFSGRHNFAVDYAAHQRNAMRYQSALNHRNIR